ncbi:MAG: protein-L-isoaspartate(D-aspartate) O-methyltransferase [Mobilitalea sp.]
MNEAELLDFFEKLDRSAFIDNEYKRYSEVDQALPIGFGQTISQPTLVLEMTKLLDPNPDSRVLEIGTGSGYQTALLAKFSGQVYTVERIRELSLSAQDRLEEMGYTNIFFKIGDGSEGWVEHAPYDRIMVTAAASEIPEELLEQLQAGGRMIIPIGPEELQELVLVTKDRKDEIYTETIEYVKFVEFKGKYGWF